MARMKIGSSKVPSYNMGGSGSNPMQSLENAMGLSLLKQMMGQQQQDRDRAALPAGAVPVRTKIGETAYELPGAAQAAGQEIQARKQAEATAAQATGRRAVSRSAEAVTASIGRLARGWADAYKEGGVGNRLRSWISSGAQAVGGETGDFFKKTGALPGLKTEIIARMMPILTQQGDKPGSVRLVESIFRKLGETLPAGHTGPETAKEQMSASIRNMYGYAKAFYDLGVDADEFDAMDEIQKNEYLGMLEDAKEKVMTSPEESEAMAQIEAGVLSPLDEIIAGNRGPIVKFPPLLGMGGGQQSQQVGAGKPQTGTIMMLAPDGTEVPVHSSKIQDAIKRGLKMPQGA